MKELINDENIELIKKLLVIIGDDPTRPGLIDTPKRVLKAYKEYFSGYNQNPIEILNTQFSQEEYEVDSMIICRNIEFYSTCEHHMAPFTGYAHVAYLPKPGSKVVGLSKLARLVDVFAKRLQIQEKLTSQIANTLFEALEPAGVGVVIKARHFCMCSRGVNKQDSEMITSKLIGEFKTNSSTRAEFLKLVGCI
ncbi:MAG: GTP cyclohydrolase I FolE [Candidatus Cloacimonadota bacterium]|nr:MAG: GTP cyclohydrolase I FolE [Candidatus Cloacimonadota bacterium]